MGSGLSDSRITIAQQPRGHWKSGVFRHDAPDYRLMDNSGATSDMRGQA